MFKSVIHQREFEDLVSHGTIEYGLRFIKGNQLPHFSVTVSGKQKSARGRGSDFGGCCHDLVAKVAPDTQPLIALHMADSDGTPMHAEANGWYWLAGHLGGLQQEFHGCNGDFPKSPDEALQIFADLVRIDLNEARGLAVAVQTIVEAQGAKKAREFFAEWIKAQQPRWRAEADKAIADFDLSAALG